jgi:hypothetical protein
VVDGAPEYPHATLLLSVGKWPQAEQEAFELPFRPPMTSIDLELDAPAPAHFESQDSANRANTAEVDVGAIAPLDAGRRADVQSPVGLGRSFGSLRQNHK